ncbi:MAG: hypothetical protein DMF68_01525 [Acidobacteria bacterium]|nr:MAG: hypothetical protein DMF68_01525 [Acidobacteriota bacterium]
MGLLARAKDLINTAISKTPLTEIDFRLLLTNNKAIFARASGDLYEALRLQTEAGHLASQSKDAHLLGNHFHGLGVTNEMIYEREGSEIYFDRALLAYTEACHYYEVSACTREYASTLNCIAYLFVRAERVEDALDYSVRAFDEARIVRDEGLIAECLLTRAQAFLLRKWYDTALTFASEARRIFQAKGFGLLRDDAHKTIEKILGAMREEDCAAQDSNSPALHGVRT